MAQTLALLAAFLVGLAAFIAFFAWWDRRNTRRSFAALLEALGGTLRGKTLSGDFRGSPFRVVYSPGGSRSASSCAVTLAVPVPGRLAVRRENQFDQSAKKKGFVVEIQTGDEAFDGSFFIDTREPEFARLCLADEARRRTVASLLDGTAGALEVRMGPEGAGLRICPFSVSRLQPAEMTGILDGLLALTEKAPAAPVLPEASVRRNRFKPLLAVVIGVEVAGTAGAVAALTRYPPVGGGIIAFSLVFSVPLAALFLWGSRRALRGGSSSHTSFGILVALSVFAFLPAGVAIAGFLNGTEESAPPSVRQASVLEKRIVQGEDGYVYQLLYASWRKEGQREEQPVEKTLYDRIAEGDLLVFTERTGRLGFAWRAGFKWKPRG